MSEPRDVIEIEPKPRPKIQPDEPGPVIPPESEGELPPPNRRRR